MTFPPSLNDWLAEPTPSVWDVVFAALTLLAAWIASIFARRGVIAVSHRLSGVSDGLAILAARIIRYAIILTGVGIALVFLGASIQPLIAVALIIAVVLFLALRGVSANFAAGVILQTRHPLNVGDDIIHNEFHGTVQELNGRSVVILTTDGRTVHIPNVDVLGQPIVNYTTAGRRRSEIYLRVTHPNDTINTLQHLITDTLEALDSTLTTAPCRILWTTIEPERTSATIQFWHLPASASLVVSDTTRALADRLAHEGITAVVTSEHASPALTPPPAF